MPSSISVRPRWTALALALALAATTAAAQSDAPRRYDLPAQPLNATLARIAGESGARVSVDAELARGVTAAAVQGEFTPEQALRQALSGTALELARTGSGGLTLRRAAAGATAPAPAPVSERPADTVRLREVTVTAEADRSGATEGTGLYTAARTGVAAPLGLSARETPQSVSVLTRQRLDDQGITTLSEAMQQTTGMVVTPFGTGNGNVAARGYTLDNIQVDGASIPAGQGAWTTSLFDLAFYDRVEVLRGPAGLTQGSGDPGGAINLVRKRAQPQFAASALVSAGSWDRYRTEFDVGGPLGGDGRLRGRLVAVHSDEHSFVDLVNSRKSGLYGTVELDLAPATTLSLAATRQNFEARPYLTLAHYTDGSLPDVPRSTYVGTRWQNKQDQLGTYLAELEHRLDGGGRVLVSARATEREGTAKNMAWSEGRIDRATGRFTSSSIAYGYAQRDLNLDAQLNTPFALAGRTHELAVGINHRKARNALHNSLRSPSTVFDIGAIDVDLPEPDLYANGRSDRSSRTTESGLYTQVRMHVAEPTRVLLGARLSRWEYDDLVTPSGSYRIASQLTPYLGLVQELTHEWSAYASLTGIFQPQSTRDRSGQVLKPREGEQFEVGLKGELLDKRLNAHLALFRIQDENRAMTDPNDALFSIAAGKVRSEGLEAELGGQLLPQWNLVAGYAYTRSKFLENISGANNLAGRDFNGAFPRHKFSLWTHYAFAQGALRGFSLGGGARYSSATYNDNYAKGWDSVKFEQGGYTLLSAQVGYQLHPQWKLTLAVNNLADKRYVERIGLAWGTVFGEPRNAVLSLRGSF